MSRGRSDVTNTDDLSAAAPTRDSLENLLSDSIQAPRIDVPGGPRIADRYIVLRAQGGTDVYLARDLELERDVVIELYRDTDDIETLHREALALARVAHPNVLTVLQVGEHGDRTFVATELVEGTTLRGWLAERHRSRREILAVLLGAGEGIAAAHAAGVVHRDLEPESILVGPDGHARVRHFGLARRQAPERASTLDITMDSSGVVPVGPLAYTSPEQLRRQAVGPAADQYAFAVIAWEALFGERPAVSAPGRAPTAVGAKPQSTKGRSVLRRALASEPADRFPSLRALLAALRRADRIRRALVISVAVVVAIAVAAGLTWRAHQLDGDRAGARP
jgi:serine/threonine protein kinase